MRVCRWIKAGVSCVLVLGLWFGPVNISQAGEDRWASTDKALHLAGGCAVSMLSYEWYKKHTSWTDTQARLAAFATSVTASVLKECFDSRFSGKDMAAGTAGAAIGAAIAFEF
mgnify:CR=1 FL=1